MQRVDLACLTDFVVRYDCNYGTQQVKSGSGAWFLATFVTPLWQLLFMISQVSGGNYAFLIFFSTFSLAACIFLSCACFPYWHVKMSFIIANLITDWLGQKYLLWCLYQCTLFLLCQVFRLKIFLQVQLWTLSRAFLVSCYPVMMWLRSHIIIMVGRTSPF